MPTRSYPFELKQLSERGEFSGIASVYGITDLGNDSVEAGAFSKSISDKGPIAHVVVASRCPYRDRHTQRQPECAAGQRKADNGRPGRAGSL